MDYTQITKENYAEFIKYLEDLSDGKYRNFHSSIVKNSSLEILGIRTPVLKEIAKQILKGDYIGYLQNSGRLYYEEVMIRGYVTAQVKTVSFEKSRELTEDFLPYIDNWAVCDGFCSAFKRIKKFLPEYFDYIGELASDENVWRKRAALVLMLNYYLEDDYIDTVLERCQNIISEEYYVQMAQAWLLATAYINYSDKVKEILCSDRICVSVKKMAIQKCIDSYRITDDDKDYLRNLRGKIKK